MARLQPAELRAVWAAYMEDASARREHIPFLKLELLDEIRALDIAQDKGDPVVSTRLHPNETARIADRLNKTRTRWVPPPDPITLDPADLAELEAENG